MKKGDQQSDRLFSLPGTEPCHAIAGFLPSSSSFLFCRIRYKLYQNGLVLLKPAHVLFNFVFSANATLAAQPRTIPIASCSPLRFSPAGSSLSSCPATTVSFIPPSTS